MKINQVAEALNGTSAVKGIIDQATGKSAVVAEDLSNIVEIGKELAASDTFGADNFDSFTRDLIDQVGKIMFVNRAYRSQAPNILMDGWEYGSVLEKVRCELPETRDNATWDLFNYPVSGGAAYPDPFELSKPDVKAKFFNSKTTYEVPITLTTAQVKEAFQSASQMSSFIAMIENRIQMKITLCNDALIMATIDNLVGQALHASVTTGTGSDAVTTYTNRVGLVTLYNTAKGLTGNTALTAATALTDKEFLRFASKTIGLYKKYFAAASDQYNIGDYITFTPEEDLKFVCVAEFAKALDSYLYSDTFHNEFVKLPGYEEIAYWQSGKDGERTKIDVKIDVNGTATEVTNNNVLAVMFDREGAAVCNQNYRVTSIYNPRGEYTNYFYKWDAMYMNDTLENVVVFTLD